MVTTIEESNKQLLNELYITLLSEINHTKDGQVKNGLGIAIHHVNEKLKEME